MHKTIQELEREIELFHKNIKDSNELINLLTSVVSLTKTQTDSFEKQTNFLRKEVSKLPPEVHEIFQKKTEDFLQEVHQEYEASQGAIATLMEKYAKEIARSENSIAKVPDILNEQTDVAHKKYLEDLEKTGNAHKKELSAIIEQHCNTLAIAAEAIKKTPDTLSAQNEAAQKRHVEALGNIEASYSQTLTSSMEHLVTQVTETADSIAKVPDILNEHLALFQVTLEKVRAIPEQIKEDSVQQHRAFLKEFETLVNVHLTQIYNTEAHLVALSDQLESKYNAFVCKLESSSVDQLYEYCQGMNKSINTKLGFVIGCIVIAVIVFVVSLFI